MIYEFGELYTVRTNHIKWTAKTRPLTLCRVPKARICITCLCFSLFLHACLNQPSAFSAILFILTSAVISYPDLLTHFALAAILNTFPSSLEILVTWFCCVPGLCLNNTVQKDSRGVLGTTFRFGRLSENSRQISNMADWAFKAGIKEAEKQGFYCTLHPIHVQCLFKHEIGVELFNVFEKNFC